MILLRRFSLCGLFLLLSSCGEETDPNRKTTFPVTGRVTVDGVAPSSPLTITCHDLDGIDQTNPTFSKCHTGEDGAFSMNTYETGDGVPEGKYALTFEWGQWNGISNSYGGPDKLKKRYDDPKTSKVQFEVDGSGPVDLGTIALTTK